MTKVCFKCSVEKDLSDFYKHPKMVDGRLNKCKDCAKKDVKDKYKEDIKNPEYLAKERLRGRKKHHRLYSILSDNQKELDDDYYRIRCTPEERAELRKLTLKKFEQKFPEKRKAGSKTRKFPQIKGFEYHHWSYNEEHFSCVFHVSIKDHNKIHQYIEYDRNFKMYRLKSDNSLLDTREKHKNYINSLGIKELNIQL